MTMFVPLKPLIDLVLVTIILFSIIIFIRCLNPKNNMSLYHVLYVFGLALL